MRKLRAARVLNVAGIRNIPLCDLEQLVRSSGYFRQKASRLKGFISFLDEKYAGSLTKMFAQPTALLREQLLSLNGVGPETADSILLYAGQHPVFVVDAYTRQTRRSPPDRTGRRNLRGIAYAIRARSRERFTTLNRCSAALWRRNSSAFTDEPRQALRHSTGLE